MANQNITITEQSREFDKREVYKLCYGNGGISVKDMQDGETIDVADYCIYETDNHDGEHVELLSILSRDGKVYQTQSDTFKREFANIYHLMTPDEFSIEKMSGTTKAGRDFVTCTLV